MGSEKIPFLRDPDKRSILYQIVTVITLGLLSFYLINNILTNLEKQSIATGFGFISKEASFEIGQTLIQYSSSDSYGRALCVGFLNTLIVSVIGIILTVILGTFIGIARLSTNLIVSKLAAIFIEVFQNIPILLQLFFWYAFFYQGLPSTKQAINPFSGVFLTNRGFIFGVPKWHPLYKYVVIFFVLACIIVFVINKFAKKYQAQTGKIFSVFKLSVLILIGVPMLIWIFGGAPLEMNVPVLKGFNFQGGVNISPEFSALLLGLVLYTAAFVAEIIRAGIQSVSKGQKEAAMSIGLKQGQILRLVILPQALRVIIPPLINQMLNLTKNSSLAVAIGYPDFVSVAGTTINQTGQAIEGVALIMIVYLIFSLSTSGFMNWYNKKVAIVEK